MFNLMPVFISTSFCCTSIIKEERIWLHIFLAKGSGSYCKTLHDKILPPE